MRREKQTKSGQAFKTCSAGCTGAVTLSQAYINLSAWAFGAGCSRYKAHCIKESFNICRLEFTCAGCTSKSLGVSQSVTN